MWRLSSVSTSEDRALFVLRTFHALWLSSIKKLWNLRKTYKRVPDLHSCRAQFRSAANLKRSRKKWTFSEACSAFTTSGAAPRSKFLSFPFFFQIFFVKDVAPFTFCSLASPPIGTGLGLLISSTDLLRKSVQSSSSPFSKDDHWYLTRRTELRLRAHEPWSFPKRIFRPRIQFVPLTELCVLCDLRVFSGFVPVTIKPNWCSNFVHARPLRPLIDANLSAGFGECAWKHREALLGAMRNNQSDGSSY